MGQLLYNGIRLPDAWPPRLEGLTDEPMAVPYLDSPPGVILIDVGRQLFVDDFLIEQTTLRRRFHSAAYHPDNPIVRPDRLWEQEITDIFGEATAAMPFSDGVWYDPRDRLFKMFYMGGFMQTTCLATSSDGIHWEKPSLGVEPGTNVVLREGRERKRTATSASNTVWLDHNETDPRRRFKMFATIEPTPGVAVTTLRVSADGISWSEPLAVSPTQGDRTTVFYNPFRQVWVHNLRGWRQEWGRYRAYVENPDPVALLGWREGDPAPWVGSDRLDPPRPELKIKPQLYTLDCVAYESLLLGAFSIWRGECADGTKKQDVCLGFSRDGFHWDRPDRSAFLANAESPEEWNWGYVHAAGGVCLIVGDKLYFYACGRSPVPGGALGTAGARTYQTGLATLRRDGFASMEAEASAGTLTTRPVRFSGQHLFVNAATAQGQLTVEVLDDEGRPLVPFTETACTSITADKTMVEVKWDGADNLSVLSGRPVRFRFHVRGGALYSFWVTPGGSGASHGYVAAGGPDFTGPIDTVGDAALR